MYHNARLHHQNNFLKISIFLPHASVVCVLFCIYYLSSIVRPKSESYRIFYL